MPEMSYTYSDVRKNSKQWKECALNCICINNFYNIFCTNKNNRHKILKKNIFYKPFVNI